MLIVPQIEAVRKVNAHLYEALKRIVAAINAPGTPPTVDPSAGKQFLAKGSVPPTWSGAFTYVSTTSSIAWSWTGLVIYRADGTTTQVPSGTLVVAGLA